MRDKGGMEVAVSSTNGTVVVAFTFESVAEAGRLEGVVNEQIAKGFINLNFGHLPTSTEVHNKQ